MKELRKVDSDFQIFVFFDVINRNNMVLFCIKKGKLFLFSHLSLIITHDVFGRFMRPFLFLNSCQCYVRSV